MKIIALSDMHGKLPCIKSKCDVLCICGDILPLEYQCRHNSSKIWLETVFNEWIDSIKCNRVIIVPGNHDFIFQQDVVNCKSSLYTCLPKPELNKKVTVLVDGIIYIDGVTFYGTPWCPNLKKWAFYADHCELVEKFSMIPNDVDVLLTHSPGNGIDGTGISTFNDGRMINFGCGELYETVLKKNVKLWLCGHIHSGNHEITKIEGTNTYVANVSIVGEDYFPRYKPLKVEFLPRFHRIKGAK